MVLLSFALLSLHLAGGALARGRNDWKKPCFKGECFYDMPDRGDGKTATGNSGTLKIWGAPGAISDITEAAGWEVLGCNADAKEQDVRIVCVGGEECENLFSGSGAVNKIVRLPENCGASAFARISRDAISDDQTIPEHVAKRMVKRADRRVKEVHSVHFDTNFGAVDSSKTGVIKFALLGATLSGADDESISFPSDLNKRGEKTGFVQNALHAVESLHESQGSIDKRLFNVEIDKSYALPAMTVDVTKTLIDKTMTCHSATSRIKVVADIAATARVTIGFAAEGELVPPRVNDFAVYSSLTGNINGYADITAGVAGTVNVLTVKLLQVYGDVFGYTGILTIGPSFRVDAEADATVFMDATVRAGLKYTFTGAKLTFPGARSQLQNTKFAIGNTYVKVALKPTAAPKGAVTVHIVPKLVFGIDAIDGAATANVFVGLDAAAIVNIDMTSKVTRRDVPQIRGSGPMGAAASLDLAERDLDKRAVTFNGCLDVDASFNVIAGANAKFFSLFDSTLKIGLYNKKFGIFEKCYGTSARSLPASDDDEDLEVSPLHTLEKRFACPVPIATTFSTLVAKTVLASAITSN